MSEFAGISSERLYSCKNNLLGEKEYSFDSNIANYFNFIFKSKSFKVGTKKQQEFIKEYIDYAEKVTNEELEYNDMPEVYQKLDLYLGSIV